VPLLKKTLLVFLMHRLQQMRPLPLLLPLQLLQPLLNQLLRLQLLLLVAAMILPGILLQLSCQVESEGGHLPALPRPRLRNSRRIEHAASAITQHLCRIITLEDIKQVRRA
jgi:hypothetical protein